MVKGNREPSSTSQRKLELIPIGNDSDIRKSAMFIIAEEWSWKHSYYKTTTKCFLIFTEGRHWCPKKAVRVLRKRNIFTTRGGKISAGISFKYLSTPHTKKNHFKKKTIKLGLFSTYPRIMQQTELIWFIKRSEYFKNKKEIQQTEFEMAYLLVSLQVPSRGILYKSVHKW